MRYFSMHGPNDPSLAVVKMSHQCHTSAELARARRGVIQAEACPGRLVDYPPNDFVGWAGLHSERLRNVLLPFAQSLGWTSVTVKTSEGNRPFFALYPLQYPDVLDEVRTIRDPQTGIVIKPVLSKTKVAPLDLFVVDEISVSPICSENVRRVLLDEQITGIVFSARPLA